MAGDRDFVIELVQVQDAPGQYDIAVKSPAGDHRVRIELSTRDLTEELAVLQANVLASAAAARSAVSELERPVRRVGSVLFGRRVSRYRASAVSCQPAAGGEPG